MSFPHYERYKNSGVEWLGEVPKHWSINPLYSLGKEREESNGGLISDNLLSLSYGRIIKKDIETSDGLLPESFETYQIVHSGDIIFRLTDLQNDKRSLRTAIVTELGIITFAYAAFEPRVILPAYLNYLLRDYDLRKIFYSMGGGVRQSMKFDDVKRLPTLVPPKNEQSAIVQFLDYETAKIDALIEEQRRLIDLLKEKRQAVISHSVTKGLNPDVPMKDSGIDWIGKLPKHWRVGRCGFYLSILSGFAFPSDQFSHDDSDTRLLRGINVGVGRTRWDDTVYWRRVPNDGLEIYEMRDGDLILGMDRPLIGGGVRVAKLMTSDVPCLLLQRVTCLKVQPSLNADYLLALLSSEMFIAHFAPETTGVSVPHISPEQISNFTIPLPPIEEQHSIAAYIQTEIKRSDELTNAGEHAIQLLHERRSALISAAVTGKMDVRAYMAKPEMNATQYSSGFAHQLLAAEILDRCNSQRMGRIKLQKLIHLCEYHGQVSEVQGDYSRKAAGPFDARAMAGISKNLKKQKWFEEVKEGERYVYRSLEKRGEHKKYLAHWQAEMPRIDEVLSLLGNFKTRECEIVSTLYAAWNDLLIDGGSTDDAAILHEASSAERWHKSKEQIAPERWKKALQWMKDKGLVPVGYGKHTRHPAGQIGTTTEVAHEPA